MTATQRAEQRFKKQIDHSSDKDLRFKRKDDTLSIRKSAREKKLGQHRNEFLETEERGYSDEEDQSLFLKP
ncbi:MAG: hypothetical protein EZS28_036277 [Streblomastix strix]|uniref:IBB domain-containing protein n=1 Tax=Streblomastix strix TaxID=222440 RepID=A0A5J4UCF4_9EUKA|nr:MAG: hypothetical protein EZS28_036277 [Streblomastix strix]